MIILFIDVRPILSGETDTVEFDYMLDPPESFEDICFDTPVRITGKIVNMAGYIELKAKAMVSFVTHCARCMREIRRETETDFTRALAAHLQNEDDADEYMMICDNKVDLDTPLLEELMLSIGFSYLCNEDCKGLCPKCGKDLNEGDCGCVFEKEIDPRLAILAKLLDK